MAELALGIASLAGTVDVCIKWGKALVRACDDYREADAKTGEMIVRIKVCWARVRSQLEVTMSLEDAMTDEQKDLQQRTLSILQSKLDIAIQRVSKFDKSATLGTARKIKFAFLKDVLDETITELELWQSRYEPTWYQLIKLAAPTVDRTLNNIIVAGPRAAKESTMVARHFRRAFEEPSGESTSVFIRGEALECCTKAALPYSSAMVATRPGGSGQLIVDRATNRAVQAKDAREFARRLRHSDPFVFGLFSCKGVVVVRHADFTGMTFLFRIPEGYNAIRSVRHLLLSGQQHDSLSDRLEMAKQLANAVYYVHLYGFVHKNIHPETILSLGKTADGPLPATAFLVGFQVIRNADGRTYPVTDKKRETNLYRHPLRQGDNAEYYVMQHDIYSLGVCLLEIGLWESFVTFNEDGVARPSTALGIAEDKWQLNDPFALKEHLVALSRSSSLRAKMGTRYSEVVTTCLTCLDKDNVDFGDEQEFQDEDGVAVGVRYIEKVLGILSGICI